MLKTYVTLALTFFFLFASTTDADAATKKSKRKTSKSSVSKSIKSGKKSKSKRYAKYKRKRGGSSVDLRALTTESPYTENTDNGVNSVETKPGIQ